MENKGKTKVVVHMQLKPGLVRFQDAQEEIADLLVSLYRLFGPVNPEAEYVVMTGTDNGDLWLWIIEHIPPDEKEGLEEPLTEDDLEELVGEEGGES